MKLISSLSLISTFILSASSYTFNINSPYDTITWPANTDAVIKFSLKEGTSPPPSDFKVCIDLMRGDPKDSQQLLTISCDVPWNINQVYWKVPDFPTNNDYFVRVGTSAEWAYSHTFKITGNGTTPLPKPRPTDLPPAPTPTPTKIQDQGNNNNGTSKGSKDSGNDGGSSFRAPSGDYTYQPQNANLDKDNSTSSGSSGTSSKQTTKSNAQTFSLPIILNLIIITSILSL